MRSFGRRAAIGSAISLAATMGAGRAWAADPIRIGSSVPLTGGLALNGKAYLLTMQLFAEDINAKGGINGRPLDFVYYDDQSNPANVPAIYTKLLDVDKVDLVCSNGTNLTTPAMPVVMVTIPDVSFPATLTVGVVHAAVPAAMVGAVPPVMI